MIAQLSKGNFISWIDNCIIESGLIIYVTPPPWNFIVAFCESKLSDTGKMVITPLLLLKNAVPFYNINRPLNVGSISCQLWTKIKTIILFHNPGLTGCLKEFDMKYS
ncbi:hypothetical protein [Sporolactobacillus sp. KGMB 08714]|uniref:hypothetical protein n=1 Tax=Sporolactobacillus sp. KGMB 08714 TaxID=3064704 RepID=UPI002FBE673D